MMRRKLALWLGAALCGLSACSNADDGDEDFETQATLGVKDFVGVQLQKLSSAAQAIQDAAPEADEDGWNADDDPESLEDMRAAWKQARSAYEHIEGSIAVLFAGLDVDTDARYDAFIEIDPDDYLFDGEGVIGMHAIERILWSDSTPDYVVKFEEALPGYQAAAFPQTKQEADDFKNALCARLVKDTQKMRDDFDSIALQAGTAFRGMILSVQEQSEKTNKAATGEDESRYAQNTLADMRANLSGARSVYEAFKPWIEATDGDTETIESNLDKLDQAYDAVDGDALPRVPDGFNPDEPSDKDLSTAYGKLWKLLVEQTDEDQADSLVALMADAADGMQLPGIEAEQ